MSLTRISCHINGPRAAVYRALLDPRMVAKWRVPDGMTAHVHAFEAREGGTVRISLTDDTSTDIGKTDPHTDTYHGRFVKLVPNEQVVEVDEFETSDPALQGEMTSSITLADADVPPICSLFTTDYRPAFLPLTMKLVGEWHSQS